MPFNRPTLSILIDRAATDIEARMAGVNARLRRSLLEVLTRVHSAVAHGLYGYLDFQSRQILPDTAEQEYLERHANLWLKNGRKSASAANGEAVFKGAEGSLIPAGTLLRRKDGEDFEVEEDVFIKNGQVRARIIAKNLGQSGNTARGGGLNLVSPILGINATAEVDALGLAGGAEAEDDAALLSRLLYRLQNPPMGGAAHDYIAWALELPGVTRAWCYPLEQGLGTVVLRFVCDDAISPISDARTVAQMAAHLAQKRPVTASLIVLPPVALPITFKIKLLPDSASARAAVEARLRDLLKTAQPEGDGVSGRILISHIREAISSAAGEFDHELLFPIANISPPKGQMAVFSGIEWVAS